MHGRRELLVATTYTLKSSKIMTKQTAVEKFSPWALRGQGWPFPMNWLVDKGLNCDFACLHVQAAQAASSKYHLTFRPEILHINHITTWSTIVQTGNKFTCRDMIEVLVFTSCSIIADDTSDLAWWELVLVLELLVRQASKVTMQSLVY